MRPFSHPFIKNTALQKAIDYRPKRHCVCTVIIFKVMFLFSLIALTFMKGGRANCESEKLNPTDTSNFIFNL